tara:strand:- start:327 stop:554 length:228 start_codon:yes stop_codon:yes gene_type:complete
MRDIDTHEAMRNLNPCSDKLGRDRDFKDGVNMSLNWLTKEIKELKERIKVLECNKNTTCEMKRNCTKRSCQNTTK